MRDRSMSDHTYDQNLNFDLNKQRDIGSEYEIVNLNVLNEPNHVNDAVSQHQTDVETHDKFTLLDLEPTICIHAQAFLKKSNGIQSSQTKQPCNLKADKGADELQAAKAALKDEAACLKLCEL